MGGVNTYVIKKKTLRLIIFYGVVAYIYVLISEKKKKRIIGEGTTGCKKLECV